VRRVPEATAVGDPDGAALGGLPVSRLGGRPLLRGLALGLGARGR